MQHEMKIGFIYKITNNVDDRFYIGSTRKTLKARFKMHKDTSTTVGDRDYNLKLYKCMREIGKKHFKIDLVKEVEYGERVELLKQEAECILDMGFSLNVLLPYVSIEDRTARVKKWHLENKETICAYKAEYYKDNKKEINEKCKLNYLKNADAIKRQTKKYAEENKEKVKETKALYRETNKEEIARKAKIWREENKERLSEKKKIKETCECGHIGLKSTMTRHRRSKTHINAMN